MPSSDLNILLEKPLGSRRRSTRGGSLKSTLARARESQRAEEEAHESAAERKARQMREARDRARDACRRGEWSRADEALTEALGVAAQPKRSAAYRRGCTRRARWSRSAARRRSRRALDDADAAVAADPRQPAGFFQQGGALAHAPAGDVSRHPPPKRYSWPVPPKGTWGADHVAARAAGRRSSTPRACEHAAARGDGAATAGALVGECTTSTIAVSWREVEFDGGDGVNQCELRVASVTGSILRPTGV